MAQVQTQAWQKMAFRALRRIENEFTSIRLRRVAARWFDLDVGLYSYGCFDSDRFPPGTRIGRYCSIARSAASFNTNHPPGAAILHPVSYHPGFGAVDDWQISSEPLTIEDDVWLGHNVTILPGTGKIGRGAIVAAGAVVNRPVEPYMIVVGVPAKLFRPRFSDERIADIEESGWWRLSPPDLRLFLDSHPDWLGAERKARLRNDINPREIFS